MVAAALASAVLLTVATGASGAAKPDAALQRALEKIVGRADGPPGISVVVQRGAQIRFFTAGVADRATKVPFAATDAMRLASVAKAFSGAAAVSAVADGKLSLDDTVGTILPGQPSAWGDVTLAQLLQHTSGVPDFSQEPTFQEAVGASLGVAPAPEALLAYVAGEPLSFTPGSRYQYSNSDNILVGLMVAAVDGRSYPESLTARVDTPLGLSATSLPNGVEMSAPFVHGYQPDPPNADEDVSEAIAAGWSWASGGVVSTPQDANRFVRGYVSGALTDPVTRSAQFSFRAGSSEPPGPGANSAGLAVFRYRTRCGTVYGHTGNTLGYTQFIASSRDGTRSTVVSINSQLTPERNAERFAELRVIYGTAVCAAMRGK